MSKPEKPSCTRCGSDRLIPYEFKPPQQHRGNHTCSQACITTGTLCLNCRIVRG